MIRTREREKKTEYSKQRPWSYSIFFFFAAASFLPRDRQCIQNNKIPSKCYQRCKEEKNL